MAEVTEFDNDNSDWEELGSGDIVQFTEKGQVLQGELVNKRDGQYGKVFDIRTDDGEEKTVFGTTILEDKMQSASIGDEVRITFLGHMETNTGRNAKNFKVERKKK